MAHTHTDPPNMVISESVRINCPASSLFAYVSNYENDPCWRSAVSSMKQDSPGPARPGTTTVEVLNVMGNETTTVARIVELEAGRRIAFQSVDGPVEASGYRLVEPDGTGCIFTYHLQLLISGIPESVVSELATELGAMVHGDLQCLKAHLESAPVAPADLVTTNARR